MIAIENSNCQDYVTEKLVHAVASGSVPIVAGMGMKDAPNYLKFMPSNSYINIYDFATIDSLVSHLKMVASNRDEYEKYIWFKQKKSTKNLTTKLNSINNTNIFDRSFANKSREYFERVAMQRNFKEKVNLTFFNELISKESSENKLCKVARYLTLNTDERIRNEIEKRRSNRPDDKNVCLPRLHIVKHFELFKEK